MNVYGADLAFFTMVGLIIVCSAFPTAFADESSSNQSVAFLSDDRKPLYLSLNATSSQSILSELTVTLYQKDMQSRVYFVTYAITIRDMADNSTVLRNVFHAQTGTAVLRFVQVGEEGVANITGTQEPFLNAWIADENVTLFSPDLRAGGVYEISISILGIDSIRLLFVPEMVPELRFVLDTAKEDTMAAQVEVVPEFPQLGVLAAGSILSVFVVWARMKKRF